MGEVIPAQPTSLVTLLGNLLGLLGVGQCSLHLRAIECLRIGSLRQLHRRAGDASLQRQVALTDGLLTHLRRDDAYVVASAYRFGSELDQPERLAITGLSDHEGERSTNGLASKDLVQLPDTRREVQKHLVVLGRLDDDRHVAGSTQLRSKTFVLLGRGSDTEPGSLEELLLDDLLVDRNEPSSLDVIESERRSVLVQDLRPNGVSDLGSDVTCPALLGQPLSHHHVSNWELHASRLLGGVEVEQHSRVLVRLRVPGSIHLRVRHGYTSAQQHRNRYGLTKGLIDLQCRETGN